jgi:hypothetical protein
MTTSRSAARDPSLFLTQVAHAHHRREHAKDGLAFVDWTNHLGPILIAFSVNNDKTSRTDHEVKAAHLAYHIFARLKFLTPK